MANQNWCCALSGLCFDCCQTRHCANWFEEAEVVLICDWCLVKQYSATPVFNWPGIRPGGKEEASDLIMFTLITNWKSQGPNSIGNKTE